MQFRPVPSDAFAMLNYVAMLNFPMLDIYFPIIFGEQFGSKSLNYCCENNKFDIFMEANFLSGCRPYTFPVGSSRKTLSKNC